MIEILKGQAHMCTVFNRNLTGGWFKTKQVIKKQPLAKAKGIKTTPSLNHSTTVPTLRTLQPTHLPKPQLIPDLEK